MCGDGCGCSSGSHLRVIEGGKKSKENPEDRRMDGPELYAHLVSESLLTYQRFEDGELTKERTLGYLTAMEDLIRKAWGDSSELYHSVRKLINDVDNY